MLTIHTDKLSLTTNLPSIMAIMIWILVSFIVFSAAEIFIAVVREYTSHKGSSWANPAILGSLLVSLVVSGYFYHGFYVANMTHDLKEIAAMLQGFGVL